MSGLFVLSQSLQSDYFALSLCVKNTNIGVVDLVCHELIEAGYHLLVHCYFFFICPMYYRAEGFVKQQQGGGDQSSIMELQTLSMFLATNNKLTSNLKEALDEVRKFPSLLSYIFLEAFSNKSNEWFSGLSSDKFRHCPGHIFCQSWLHTDYLPVSWSVNDFIDAILVLPCATQHAGPHISGNEE